MNRLQSVIAAWVAGMGSAATLHGQAPYLVRDFTTAAASSSDSNPRFLTQLGDRVLFIADADLGDIGAAATVQQLVSTDGTPEGTFVLATGASTLDYRSSGVSPQQMPVVGGRVVFVVNATTPGGTLELWATDGTPAGTSQIRPSFGQTPLTSNREVTEMVVVNPELALFVAHTPQHGWELWRTDGTAAGTWMVMDINQGTSAFSTGNGALTVAADRVYFSANDGIHGRELWRTDGTAAGTRLVADLIAGVDPGTGAPMGSGATPAVAVGREVLVRANIPGQGVELWRTVGDGTGLNQIHESVAGPESGSYRIHDVIEDRVMFTAQAPGQGSELFVSEAGGGPARLVADLVPGESSSGIERIGRAMNRVLFRYNHSQTTTGIFSTDGGHESADVLLEELMPLPYHGKPIVGLINREDGQTLMFVRLNDTSAGLFRTDGSPRATIELARFPMSSVLALDGNASPQTTLPDGTAIFFTRRSSDQVDLWRSDGSAQGTRLVVRLDGMSDASVCNWTLTRLSGNLLYFISRSPEATEAYAAWVTDGTATGTRQISPPGVHLRPAWEQGRPFLAVGGRLIASATDGLHGYEPWVFTRHVSGARQLMNIRRDRTLDSLLTIGRVIGNEQCVIRREGSEFGTDELWITSGSADSTRRVFVADPPIGGFSSNIVDAWAGPTGRILVLVGTRASPRSLWSVSSTPGVALGVNEVATPRIGTIEGTPVQLATGQIVFTGTGELDQRRYAWVSDGTPLGTRAIPGLAALSTATTLSAPVLVDGRALFRVKPEGEPFTSIYRFDGQTLVRLTNVDADPTTPDGSNNPELYAGMSIGPRTMMFDTWPDTGREPVVLNIDTAEVTRLDVVTGPGSPAGSCIGSCPAQPTRVVGDRWALNIALPEHGSELWLSDGTQAGTRVHDLNPGPNPSNPCVLGAIGTRVLSQAVQTEGGNPITKLIAADAQTGQIASLATVFITCPIGSPTEPEPLVPFGGNALLSAFASSHVGFEPWITNGTPEGTRQLADLYPGESSAHMTLFAVRRHRAYFVARYAASPVSFGSYELFRTDGTVEGTLRLGTMPRNPADTGFTPSTVGRRVFFIGNSVDHGSELYALDLPSECLADFDSSGAVTIEDLFAFIAAYLQQQDEADATGEGAVSVEDIFEYLRAYFDGCG